MKLPSLKTIAALIAAMTLPAVAQVNISSGTYTQNFDSLLNTGTSNPWSDNTTLPGWYAAKNLPLPTGGPIFSYRAGAGAENTGALYSYGSTNATDRALGSAASGTPGTQVYGVRFLNDTANGQALTISYTGEQWRNGGNTSPQALTFTYRIDSSITDADPNTNQAWTVVPELTFTTPVVGSTAAAVDGNASGSRQALSYSLPGVVVLPNQEIFLRWVDINDPSNDHGVALDDLTVAFTATNSAVVAPTITAQPQNRTVVEGNTATFTVQASGTAPLSYQWYFAGNPVANGTAATLNVNYATTNNAGSYYVNVSNAGGNVNSSSATLTVTPAVAIVTNIAYLRTLMDANFAPSDTTNLYSVEGTVTTYVNMTTIDHAQFYIQDGTAGIVVFVSGGQQRPAAGDRVRVVGPLGQFNGLFELNLVNANPTHSVTTIGTAPIPAATPFQFSLTNNPAFMESNIEGSLVVVSNVYLQNGGSSPFVLGGMNINMTNLQGQVLVMRVDARVTDPVGNTIPQFASSVTGVVGQFDNSSPYSSGYQVLIRQYADIVEGTPLPPVVALNVVRTGSNIEISWPETASGTLQGTASLSPVNWQAVAETPVTANGKKTVTISAASGNRFFRLQQ